VESHGDYFCFDIAVLDLYQALMKTAMRQLLLTAQAYHRVLNLSHTIAYLAGSEAIGQVHLAEALQYHPKLDLM
jgi:magnesium chelatase family protein